MGLWPGIAFNFAQVCLESRFPVTNAIERGIVSVERDGDIVSDQRSSHSHSLAHSEAAGQVNRNQNLSVRTQDDWEQTHSATTRKPMSLRQTSGQVK